MYTQQIYSTGQVHCSGQGGVFSMHYDKLVVAIGAATNTFGTKVSSPNSR
jgi:NADH dehydrogenase FAD-containing subunit